MHKSAKTIFMVAALLTFIGIVTCIVAYAMATTLISDSFDVPWALEGVTSGNFSVAARDGWSNLPFVDVEIVANTSSAECAAQKVETIILEPNGTDVRWSCVSRCSSEAIIVNDPTHLSLRTLCRFYPRAEGIYKITSTAKLWVVDDELAELAMESNLEDFVPAEVVSWVGLVFPAVGQILCCVGCCCLCLGRKS